VNITPILNSPKVLFDYLAVTGKRNDPNSLIDGIKNTLQLTGEKIKNKLDKLLKTIIITGPGAYFKGLDIKIQEDLQPIYSNQEIKVNIGQDPLNCIINGLYEYLKVTPSIKAFYLLEDTVPQELEVLKTQHSNELNETLILLKSLKTYVQDFNALEKQVNRLIEKIDLLPNSIKPIMRINILSESKFISREFKKYLKPMMSKAEQGISETEEIQNVFKQIGRGIQKLPRFIQPPLTRVFTSHVYGLKMIKTTHKDKINQELINNLHSIAINFQNRDSYSLTDLATASNLEEEAIIEILDEFMEKYSNWGYFDQRIVKFSDEILLEVESGLDFLKDKFFTALENNERENINNIIDQCIKLCELLIKGYYSQNNEGLAQRYVLEKNEFENEKIA
jgi:hypothetical protein